MGCCFGQQIDDITGGECVMQEFENSIYVVINIHRFLRGIHVRGCEINGPITQLEASLYFKFQLKRLQQLKDQLEKLPENVKGRDLVLKKVQEFLTTAPKRKENQ